MFSPLLIFGSVWDNFAVHKGHWFYPGKGLLGPFIFNIPIEDYIFIIVVTYIILVEYAFSKKFIKKNK
jgi:lycopene cyclase domain-containing protein